MILLAFITLVLWYPVFTWLDHSRVSGHLNIFHSLQAEPTNSVSSDFDLRGTTLISQLAAGLWTVLLWSLPAMIFARQGALLTAGRSMMGAREVFQLAGSRSLQAWISAIIPLLCVALLVVVIGLIGGMGGFLINLIGDSLWVRTPIALLLSMIAIPSGILAFGAIVSVPLSWAAIVNEKNPDSLDSLSRGYEYLYRRPVHLAWYFVLCAVLLLVAVFLVWCVCWAGLGIVEVTLRYLSGRTSLAQDCSRILSLIPIATAFAYSWGLVGSMYLLLRFDAGGQQVEDIWIAPERVHSALPKLPKLG